MKKRNAARPHRNCARRGTRFARGLAALLASAVMVLLLAACAAPFGTSLMLASTAAHAPVSLAAADDAAAQAGGAAATTATTDARVPLAGSLGKTLGALLFGDAGAGGASAAAPATQADDVNILEESIETPDGASFDVRVAYDASAMLPDGAKLEVAQVAATPEGYDADDPAWEERPAASERFVRAQAMEQLRAQLEKSLDVAGKDIQASAILDLRITADGEEVQPAAPVALYVRTDALGCAKDSTLCAALLEDGGTALGAVELEASAEDAVALAFETSDLGRFGLASVPGETAAAGAGADADADENEDEGEGEGEGAAETTPAQKDPASGEKTQGAEDAGDSADTGEAGEPASADTEAAAGAVPEDAGAAVSESPLMRAIIEQNIAEGRVATSSARVTFTMEAASENAGTSLQQALTARDGSAYRVRVVYGSDAKIPQGSRLVVRELDGDEAEEVRASAHGVVDGGIVYLRAFDISIVDKAGNRVEPAAPVDVQITLEDAPAAGMETSIVHLGAGTPELIDPKVKNSGNDSAFSFSTGGFSVFTVVATVPKRTLAASGGPVLTLDETVLGTAADAEIPYLITIASDSIKKEGSYSYTINGGEQADSWAAKEDGKLSLYIKHGQAIAIHGLGSGSYTITEALQEKMALKYSIGGGAEAEATGGSFTVDLNQNTIVSLKNARQYTVTNRIENLNTPRTETVLHGDSYTYGNADSTLVGVYVFNGTETVTDGVTLQMDGDHVQKVVIANVTGDYDIYGVYNKAQTGDDYTFVVAVNGKWATVNRTVYSKVIPIGSREAFLNAYVHEVYEKFYNPLFNNREEYAFGHNGSNTGTSYNRKTADGKTTFFLNNNGNMPHYLMYTPYVAANGDGEEINFSVGNGSDNCKRNSFYTIMLSNDVRDQFTQGELSDGVITGKDVAGVFALKSIDSANDLVGVTDISNPNVFGLYGRNLTVTVRVPAALLVEKNGTLSGKVTHKLMLKGVTTPSVVYDGSYNCDGNGATYTFDIPEGVLTQPFEVVRESTGYGQINYQYVDPTNTDDDLQHISGLVKVNETDQWKEGYETRPAYSFASYTANKKFVYTFDTWVDLDGTEYPVDTEITTHPESYLQLRPKWEWTKTDRIVRVEYYNLLLDAGYPVESENVHFADSNIYTVLGMAEDLFYQQSTGQRFLFNQWRTSTGGTVEARSDITLTDFGLFSAGDYEVLKLTAAWLPAVDPWNLRGQTRVIISDRFSADGYSADRRYLAMKPDKGSTAVNYIVNEGTCVVREDVPEFWTFEPRDNGTYYVKSSTGKYLNINGNNNLVVGETAQEIEILYNDSLKRYVFRKMVGNNSVLLSYNNGSKAFNAVNRAYSTASENSNNGRNARFLLATPKASVMYTYPAYDGVYSNDVEGPPTTGTTGNLPATNVDEWAQGYTIQNPTQSTYYVESKDYRWNYEFDHWEVANADSSNTRAKVGSEVTEEPLPPLVLKAVWRFVDREPASIKVKYVIERYGKGDNSTNNNDYYPRDWNSVPRVEGMSMTQSGTDNNRTYSGEDVAVKNSVTAYAPKTLTGDHYITTNGIKYVFLGWKVGGSDTPPENNLISANGPTVDLTTLDTNEDKTVELHSVWTTQTRDPWGIDGEEYLIVHDRSNTQHFAMGTEAYNTGLKKYDVGKQNLSVPVYTVTDTQVMWHFTAQDDGTYVISTKVDDAYKYLKMNAVASAGSGAEISLVTDVKEATNLYLYQYDTNGTTTYAIGFAVAGTNYKSALDCQNSNPVIMRAYGKNVWDKPHQFILGIPKPIAAVYSYPAYAGEYPSNVDAPPATGTTNNLPAAHAKRITANSYTIEAPAQRTYSVRSDIYQWNYEFAGWKVNRSENLYQPDGSYAYDINSGTGLELQAVWEFKEKVEVSKTIRYDFAFAKTPASVPTLSKQTLQEGNEERISGEALRDPYELATPNPAWYKAAATKSSSAGNVYQFMGWKDESGNLIDGAFITNILDAKYDKDGDDVITLTAYWNNEYSQKNNYSRTTREAEFFVSTVAVSADAFNDEVAISTVAGDFTQAMHFTLMQPQDMKAPDVFSNLAYDNQRNYVLVGYEDKTKVNISANDELIRQLSTATGLEKDGNTYSLMTFPTDQEVLDYLKVQDKAKLTLDGVEVDPVDMTADNFTIRWYVCKYQEDGLWHIDGKLTPNLSYLRVTKTFLGDEEALQNIPGNFEINVKSATQSEAGIINNLNKTNIHLTLNDQRSNQKKYGLYSGTATNGSYGYIEKNDNTYVWLVPVTRNAKFDITESNYTVVVDNITYGIAAQYGVRNSQSGSDVSRTPWFGTINDNIYSSTYPRTAIDVSDTSNIQSVDLFNTYVETGTFVIQKIDAGLDGTGSTPMPGVKFKVYDITGEDEKPVPLTRKWNAKTGRYNLREYDPSGIAISDDPQTGSDGCVYLRLAAPPDQEEVRERVFKIVEQVPDGYLEGEQAPYFVVTVDKKGFFTMGEQRQEPAGDYGKIEVLKTSVAGESEEDALVSGVSIFNQPKSVTISMGKIWDSANRQDSVTLQLTGKTDGTTRVSRSVALSADSSSQGNGQADDSGKKWVYTFPGQFPMMVGNAKVNYSIEETKIGAYAAGSAAFNNWQPGYITTYYGENGIKIDDYQDPFSYGKISLEVLNEDRVKDFIKTTVFKVDESGENYLSGAEFELYRELAGATEKITFGNQYKYVIDAGSLKFTDSNVSTGIPLNLEFGKTYYLRETKAPDGYDSRANGYIQIKVDAEGKVAFAYDNRGSGGDGWKDGDTVFTFKDGNPETREATLKIKNRRDVCELEFLKRDGFGKPLPGATFTLFKGYAFDADTKAQTLVEPEGVEATSASEGAKNSEDGVIDKGVVLFEKAPQGIHFMLESKAPDGFLKIAEGAASPAIYTRQAAGSAPVKAVGAAPTVYAVLLGEETLKIPENKEGTPWAGVLADITERDITNQTGEGEGARNFAIFKIDPDTGRAVSAPDIATYGIMNTSSSQRVAVLKKTDDAGNPLEGAQFQILRHDRTLVESTDINGDTVTTFTSGTSGAYFIDKLPYGTYYIHETGAPSGYQTLSDGTNWFVLTVNSDGVTVEGPLKAAP